MTVVTIAAKPSIDTTVTVDRVEPNKKLAVDSVDQAPGGGGINVARAMLRLGSDARALWVEAGAMGTVVGTMLRNEGVPNASAETGGETGQSIAIVEHETDHHYRFSTPGSAIAESEGRALADLVGDDCSWLVISGGLPEGSPARIYAILAERGAEVSAKVIIDSHDDALLAALDTGAVSLIKPNQREFDTVCEQIGLTGQRHDRAMRLIDRYRLDGIVLSMGSRGAVLFTPDWSQEFEAPHVDVVSRVGAGDSLVAGMTSRLQSGWELDEAVRYGVAAGAAAVTTPGTELCQRDRTDELYESMRD